MKLPNDKTIRTIKFKGINNVNRPEELGLDEFTKAENVYITDRNTLSKRKGVSLLLSSSKLHSLGGSSDVALVVNDNELAIVNDDNSLTSLRSDMDAGLRVSYCPVGPAIYYSNGVQSGKLIDGATVAWGVTTPLSPTLSATDGALPPGEYRVLVTEVALTGEESGSSDTVKINLPNGGGISVTCPLPLFSGFLNIYMTPANSREFYHVASTDSGAYSIRNEVTRGRPLQTLNLEPMPPGHIVRYFNSRLLVANDNTVWISEAYFLGLTKLMSNFIQFRSKVTMIEPVEGGVYISADKTYFFAGADIKQAVQQEVSSVPAIFGTSVQVDGSKYGEGTDGDIVLWVSEDGIYAGSESGKITNITEKSVSFPFGEEGAAQFFQADGAAQYVSVLREPSDDTDHFGVADKVTAEVYRNGVLIEV